MAIVHDFFASNMQRCNTLERSVHSLAALMFTHIELFHTLFIGDEPENLDAFKPRGLLTDNIGTTPANLDFRLFAPLA